MITITGNDLEDLRWQLSERTDSGCTTTTNQIGPVGSPARMIFEGTLDSFDGRTVRRRVDTDLYEFRCYRTRGLPPDVRAAGDVAVSFSESLVDVFGGMDRFSGKRIRVTVEVLP